ncbi:uncharacterized protein LOC115224481 [Octopus sinensis]|uniref:Uncharacterized protein LOC115224481 n=1 Tax=Octopus sinensis TaxID=2607531 RepID=A0A6P7TMQ7_9MOLL|nr:uncharacterized protein LOC115224481 [Octopus sinensis]
MNVLNLQLQRNNFTLIQAKSAISFISKIKLYKQNLGRKEFCQFPSMKSISHVFTEYDLRAYCAHLQQLSDDFQTRFKDLMELNIPDWVKKPSVCKPEEQNIDLQKDIVELQCDEEGKMIFENEGLHEMWLHCSVKFSLLWNEAMLFFIIFPSSYLMKKVFSAVNQVFTKSRN